MDSVELIRALGNKYSAQILEAADEPRSAQELSDELEIPIATCYRRIEELTEHGLLELHDNVLSDERRRIKVYRRDVDSVQIHFDGRLDVEVQDRSEVTTTLDDAWKTISSD